MNLNATLFGQMITFALFVWFTKAWVWPFLEKAMAARKTQIAEGLAAAERGHQGLEVAQKNAIKQLRDTRRKALGIIEDARKEAILLTEDAKAQAHIEEQRILQRAEMDVAQLVLQAKESLHEKIAEIAIMGAEKIIAQQIDPKRHKALLENLAQQL